MTIDKVLILAAGKGSRMGETGKKLPKVLWPIFEKTILELEVEYAKKINAKSIFINSYYYKRDLQRFYDDAAFSSNISLVNEKEVLDIGGAVHNLASEVGYSGNLTLMNSDQFLILDQSFFENAQDELKQYDGILFTTTVNASDGYNEVLIKDSIFTGIRENSKINSTEKVQTYIGMSMINLDKLSPQKGESKFFESVANPLTYRYKCINVDSFEYWDFGTIDKYHNNMFKLIESEDKFKQFLVETQAITLNKIKNNSYDDVRKNTIELTTNFGQKLVLEKENGRTISLDGLVESIV